MIEVRSGAATVRVTVAVVPLLIALMVTLPSFTPVTSPSAEMVAMVRSRLAQMVPEAAAVRFAVEASE